MKAEGKNPRWVQAGSVLRALRHDAGITGRTLAMRTELIYETLVPRIESGEKRLPKKRWEANAKVLGCDPKLFARVMTYYYEPEMFETLFGPDAGIDAALVSMRIIRANDESQRPGA